MLIATRKFTSAYLWLLAAYFTHLGLGQDVSNTAEINGRIDSAWRGSAFRFSPGIPAEYVRFQRAVSASCLAPPQPAIGEWRLSQDFCDEGETDCTVPEGTELGLGYGLVFTCPSGYRAIGDNFVYCRRHGRWTTIPECVKIKCEALNSESRIAYCTFFHMRVSCDFPMLPKTVAQVSCRPGYREERTYLTLRRDTLSCDEDGKWNPLPFTCIPVCGQAVSHQKPFIINGSDATIGDFPWHASLYMENRRNKTIKDFICGATLIKTNFLLTAAHCVYDDTLGRTVDPGKIYVMTGNIYRDYDHPLHDTEIIRKGRGKHVEVPYTYIGITGSYGSDIALLELEQPLAFSHILLPACLENDDNGAPILEPGVTGRLAGFGRTATAETSPILQTIEVPYVSYSECKTSKYAVKNEVFITHDKFCAGYTTGSAVCEGDSGGGLVVKRNNLWYVMGIVSVGLGVDLDNGEQTCQRFSYTLYTRVGGYMKWILETISHVEQYHLRPWKTPDLESSRKPAPNPVTIMPDTPTCSAPPQPENGQWKPHPSLCGRGSDCSIPQGTKLDSGSQLIYTCNPGYIIKGYSDIYCTGQDGWSAIPDCLNCGKAIAHQKPLSIDGTPAETGGFPWHANIYEQSNATWDKYFLCSATLIRPDFLLTAAHCVYNELTRTSKNPEKLSIIMGNVFRDYDSPLHDLRIVKKGAVKNIYRTCESYGFYAADIALLELQEPFQLSEFLLPACLDISGKNKRVLDANLHGKTSGFGISVPGASSATSQTITVSYVTYSQCERSQGRERNETSVTPDKFCAGYTNGSELCAGDSGGGLVFEEEGFWYVLGVASVPLELEKKSANDKLYCKKNSRTLYTRVSDHMAWIRAVAFSNPTERALQKQCRNL